MFSTPEEAQHPKRIDPSIRQYFQGVNQDYLDAVEDDTPFFSKETDAWYHLFALLEKAEAADLQKASIGPVAFVQLLEQPKEYRGELVTVRGILRRALLKKAPRNDYGIEQYYQTLMTPDDSPSNLIVIYYLQLPESFPTGRTIEERVTTTGFSYKRWNYTTESTIHSAPVILSKGPDWTPAPPSPEASNPNPMLILGVIALGVIVVLINLYWVFRRRRTEPDSMTDSPPDFENLKTADLAPETGERLRRLVEEQGSEES